MAKIFTCFLWLISLTLSFETSLLAERQNTWKDIERIVALGDIHGGYEEFVTILKHANLINKKLQWTGGKTHFVQTGDVPDRGPDSKKIIDLIRRLIPMADKTGGKVHALIGNHEAMNILGHLDHVHPDEYEAFKTKKSKRYQNRYFVQYVEKKKKTIPKNSDVQFNEEYRKKWNKRYPLGYVEHRLNWRVKGEYGAWVAKNNTVIIINNIMFVHGGISAAYNGLDLAQINKRVSTHLTQGRKGQERIATDPLGPLWYRGLAKNSETDEEELEQLNQTLTQYDIDHIVIGHSTTPGVILPRFSGKVILIDVGLGPAYGSNFAYLEIHNKTFTSIHRGTPIELPIGNEGNKLAYLKHLQKLDSSPSILHTLIKQSSQQAQTEDIN